MGDLEAELLRGTKQATLFSTVYALKNEHPLPTSLLESLVMATSFLSDGYELP
jgi:hypothetical protein